jgi:hypothetical protein
VLFFEESRPDLSTIAAVVARSAIRVQAQRANRPGLPAGFDDVDVAILEWIADESRPASRQRPLH